jgi:hypothetical protein
VLTIGGALGVLPGAALGDTARGTGDHAASTASDRSTTESPASGESPAGQGDSGGWLTVEPRDDTPSRTPSGEALPAMSGHGRRIVYDISDQRVWLVDHDNVVERTYPVSGGLHDNLSPDAYEVYSMSRHAVSFNNQETMNYMVRFARGSTAPIGFHDIPVYDDGKPAQRRSDLGTPQSAGCIRQWKSDAKALYRFADVGTTVVVTS